MYEFSKIKLVIWDLDDTFWKGTLSEGPVFPVERNIRLVRRLTDIGIVNSICSKNDQAQAAGELEKMGVSDVFVFSSINWEPKGQRIRDLIKDMNLRDENVLFADDNHLNLEEARFYCPRIMTAGPDELDALLDDALKSDKKDKDHKRLKQYRILEEKNTQKSRFASNEDFLYSSQIRVVDAADCEAHLDRIHDLVLRTNQLNFTKIRSSKEELEKLFRDQSVRCGYVSASDRFGDYGIIGFYALKDKEAIHFCFSCRTLGMGIEQYIYNKLGRPELTIRGEVISDLSGTELPGWINQAAAHGDPAVPAVKEETKGDRQADVLIKGPCDLFQIMPYITDRNRIDTEFTHVNNAGIVIESTGHTTQIVESIRLTQEQKDRVLAEVPFTDRSMYNDNMFRKGYKVVIISILTDANLGVYRRKGTGERFVFLEGYRPITDHRYWDAYIAGKLGTGGFRFTRENLEAFAEKYEFAGINTPEQVVENLRYIRSHLDKDCTLAVMLGGELNYEKNTNPAYEGRHIVHKKINDAIRKEAETSDIRLIDVNKYLVDQSSFYDHFNHYIKPVYYALAGEILELINEKAGLSIKETSRLKMLQVRAKEILAPYYYKLKKILK